MGSVEIKVVITSGKLLCPTANGGCGNDTFYAGIMNTFTGSRVYLKCTECEYKMSIPIDRINFVEENTGPLEILED